MKGELKQLYLDAIGESSDSVRRSQFRGIETAYTLNSEDPDKTIDVVLLDTRFDRSPLPCQTRRERWSSETISVRCLLTRSSLNISWKQGRIYIINSQSFSS